MPLQPIRPEQLRTTCDPAQFSFDTTADLDSTADIIGQPRGVRALAFGIDMISPGYNIYVLGAKGTGRSTAIKRFLEARTQEKPAPDDWLYVHNFEVPYQPRALSLPAGRGALFQTRMTRLISDISHDLRQAFDVESYVTAVQMLQDEVQLQQSALLTALQQQATAVGLVLVETASGLTLAAVGPDGRPLPPAEFQTLPAEQQQALEQARLSLIDDVDGTLRQMRDLDLAARDRLRALDREVAASAIDHHFASLNAEYVEFPAVLNYLRQVYADVLNQIDDFAPPEGSTDEIDLRRYEVNLLVDNSQTTGAPVSVVINPSFHELFGRIEFEMQSGVMTTHFTDIKPGALHQTNGGYLIVDARDLAENELAWEALKRALKGREIRLQAGPVADGAPVPAKSLSPEPIPLTIKIILVGSPGLYYYLYDYDDDFRTLFKVRVDFEDVMPRSADNEAAYASFIATRCSDEQLKPFDRTAVAKVVEYGTRLADDRKKLSTRFGAIADLIREANYWAESHGRSQVAADDVRQALAERRYRSNYLEEHLQEEILHGTLFIATDGTAAGQVNGLSVYDTGDYAFGQPSRITARTFMGDGGVIHIERETQMSGPIHDKGVLTLYGYLGGKYAQDQPLTLTASVTFEQNYGGIEGDSASLAELYAIVSCLSRIPVKQGIAVTGSFNQHGMVQPIGGVNEKIEGFFEICRARGLDGDQGVVIPASNLDNLMLNEDVVTAVADGKFGIWAVQTVDDGIELLMGEPAGRRDADGLYPEGTVHYAVQHRLRELAIQFKSFGDHSSEEQDEEDEEE